MKAIIQKETPGFLRKLALTWRAVKHILVPIGYEDGTGFHYGQAVPLLQLWQDEAVEVSHASSRS